MAEKRKFTGGGFEPLFKSRFSSEGNKTPSPVTINFSPSFCFYGEHTQNNSENLTINFNPSFSFLGERNQIKPPDQSPFVVNCTPSPLTFGEPQRQNNKPSSIFSVFPEQQRQNNNNNNNNTSSLFSQNNNNNTSSLFSPFSEQQRQNNNNNNNSPSFFSPFSEQQRQNNNNNNNSSSFFSPFSEQPRQNNNKPSGYSNPFLSPWNPPLSEQQQRSGEQRQNNQPSGFEIPKFFDFLDPLVSLGESMVKQTDFSLSLAKHVISTEAKDANFVFSPLSMHVVLSMVAAGSAGPTRTQFLDYLKSSSVEDLSSLSSRVESLLFANGGPLGGPLLSFANGVWVDKSLTLKPAFEEIVDKDYKAVSNHADFQKKADEERKEVNSWAEKKTNGLIKDLLPPKSVDDQTRLILANALYFKGVWADKFDASLTKDEDFFLLNGTYCVRVPFMTSRKEKHSVGAFDGFKVLSLPYEQGDDKRSFSMLIFLPDARDGLPDLLEKFGSEPKFIQNHLPRGSVVTRKFGVPKFKIGFGFEAKKVLRGHGLVRPFLPGGLTEMVEKGGEELCITSFFHKSCIEVDEQGTEAAAASACVIGGFGCSGPTPEVDFVADHPFLFVVREDVSGGVLFVGQLLNPAAA